MSIFLTLSRVLVVQRWVQATDLDFLRMALNIPLSTLFMKFLIRPAVHKMTWAQGMGRHSEQEVLHIARRDLTALDHFLGESWLPDEFVT